MLNGRFSFKLNFIPGLNPTRFIPGWNSRVNRNFFIPEWDFILVTCKCPLIIMFYLVNWRIWFNLLTHLCGRIRNDMKMDAWTVPNPYRSLKVTCGRKTLQIDCRVQFNNSWFIFHNSSWNFHRSISVENTYFTNHREHKPTVLKPANKSQINQQCHSFKSIINFFIE